MAGYVIRQPGHPLLSGCKFFAVGDNTSTVVPIFPPAAVPLTGTCQNGITAGTLAPFPCLHGNGSNRRVVFSTSVAYSPTSQNMTVMGRFLANAAGTGGVVSARTGPSNFGWQLLFSNFGPSEDGYNFAVFGEGKFVEAQDLIGSSTQANKNVFVCGTWDQTAKQAKMWTRQPTDPVAVYRSVNTNTNSADVNAQNWDVRSTDPLYWMFENGGATYFNGDVAWVAMFDRVLSQSEIEQWSLDSDWPFTLDVSPPLAFSSAPRAFNHPVNTIRFRKPLLQNAVVPPPPALNTNQVFPPMYQGGPLRGPWRKGPVSLAQAAPVPTPPVIPIPDQVLIGPFHGGPLKGPWNRGGPFAPKPVVVTPPTPAVVSPQVLPPVFRGGPLKGPWQSPRRPPPPVPPPPPAPPVPPPAIERPFFDIDAGKDVNVRLRRHTQKLSTALNSLIRQDILVQTGDVDWTLNTTGLNPSGLTGTFNSGPFGTG